MISVKQIEIRLFNMQTRLPFRYGISTLLACPHLFLRLTVDVDGVVTTGTAADHLPPKWFTKDPSTPFEQDVRDMLDVIRHAADHAVLAGPADSAYALASRVHQQQEVWGTEKKYPPLLRQFGVSLVERALIEAVCKAKRVTFHQAVRENLLGLRFSGHPDERLMLDYRTLGDSQPRNWLPAQPLTHILARHTVGMVDYLTDADIPAADRVDDGLPQSLESAVRYYGLTRLKIKVAGDISKDRDRLTRLFAIARRHCPPDWAYTLDCNENFKAVGPLRELWARLAEDANVRPVLDRLIFIEQPFHRDVALSPDLGRELRAWADRPPIIIDESDGYPGALTDALAAGYAGTSHKNCKGVFKGIANACLIAKLKQDHPDKPFRLSGEDLVNVGPVALQQDLAACAALGIADVERNGHHYFRGLSMHPPSVQADVLRTQPDLYHPHPTGRYPTLDIQRGRLNVASINAAPFGVPFDLDLAHYTPLSEWKFEGMELRG